MPLSMHRNTLFEATLLFDHFTNAQGLFLILEGNPHSDLSQCGFNRICRNQKSFLDIFWRS